jgi:hypothetical protein
MSQKTLERLEYLRKSRGTWRAWCAETCMPGSVGGGWKRAQKSNALTAYPTPERVGSKVLGVSNKSLFVCPIGKMRWVRNKTPRPFKAGSLRIDLLARRCVDLRMLCKHVVELLIAA